MIWILAPGVLVAAIAVAASFSKRPSRISVTVRKSAATPSDNKNTDKKGGTKNDKTVKAVKWYKSNDRVLPRDLFTVTAKALANLSKYLSKESSTDHI